MVQLASRRRIIQALHKSWANNIEGSIGNYARKYLNLVYINDLKNIQYKRLQNLP